MPHLKKLAISILSFILAFNVGCDSLNSRAKERSLADYASTYQKEVEKEVERREDRLENLEEAFIIGRYAPLYHESLARRDFYEEQREKDFGIIEDYSEDVLKDSLEEFVDDVDWLNNIENNIKRAVRYEVLFDIKKKKIEEKTPTLKEEERLENLDQKEKTAVKLKRLRFLGEYNEIHTGLEPHLSNNHPNLKVYTRIENWNMFGIEFRRGKLEIDANNDAGFKLQKLLGNGKYLEIGFKEEDFGEYSETSISFIKELQNPKSKIILTTGHDSKEKGSFITANYAMRF